MCRPDAFAIPRTQLASLPRPNCVTTLRHTQFLGGRQTGERREQAACCRGCKSLAGHGFSTFLIGNGHDRVVVQRMLRQSHVDMTMHYVHNSRKARNAQGQFIERFLPNGTTADAAEERNSEMRLRVRVCGLCGCSKLSRNAQVL